jgi:branched-chain amino acid transport system substrate-binding protein
MLNGAQIAADELNAAGGVNGRKITIVPIDDAADPDTGVAAATAAIADGLDGVVGPYNSGVGIKTQCRLR